MNISPALLPMLGLAMFGGIILCAGLLLLGEYREAFLRDPRAMMTFDVMARVGGAMGPGYLAMLLLFIGTLLILVGLADIIAIVGFRIVEVFSLIGK